MYKNFKGYLGQDGKAEIKDDFIRLAVKEEVALFI